MITVPGVVLIFAATYIVMLAVNAGEVGASWVQAIGSVLALAGAAVFPYAHEAIKQRQRKEELRKVLLLLAHNQRIELGILLRTLQRALDLRSAAPLSEYLEEGSDLKWAPHSAALNAIPIVELDYLQVDLLGKMKVMAAFGEKLVSDFRLASFYFESWRSAIGRLEDCCIACTEVVDGLSTAHSDV